MSKETSATEMLKRIEEHCGEKLKCSRQLRLHITSSIQRIINEQLRLETAIGNVLKGDSTYNPRTQRLVRAKS